MATVAISGPVVVILTERSGRACASTWRDPPGLARETVATHPRWSRLNSSRNDCHSTREMPRMLIEILPPKGISTPGVDGRQNASQGRNRNLFCLILSAGATAD